MTSTRNDARQDLYGGAFKKVVKQFFPILLFEKKRDWVSVSIPILCIWRQKNRFSPSDLFIWVEEEEGFCWSERILQQRANYYHYYYYY